MENTASGLFNYMAEAIDDGLDAVKCVILAYLSASGVYVNDEPEEKIDEWANDGIDAETRETAKKALRFMRGMQFFSDDVISEVMPDLLDLAREGIKGLSDEELEQLASLGQLGHGEGLPN